MNKLLFHQMFLFFAFCLSIHFTYAQNGNIRGKVKGREGCLQAASVSLSNKTVLTEENGEFSFSIIPGTYTIIVTHAGYNKIEQTVIVTAGNIKNLDFSMIPNEGLGEVVVLGSRSAIHRSNLNTPVPIDVVYPNDLFKYSQSEITQMIATNVPSYNSTTQTAGYTGITPATLRGLNPDQTLVLMNGIRYHNTALLNNALVIGRGTVGTDLNSIPSSSIEKIEILRDGASAQYGSDAIAGVIDVRLKKSIGKTSINLHLGQYYDGDGGATSIGINRGFNLNTKGFLNFSFDFRYRAATNRAGKYDSTVYYKINKNATAHQRDSIRALDYEKIKERGFNCGNYWPDGNAEQYNTGGMINGGYSLGKKTEIFWTGLLNYRINEGVGSYRYPKDTDMVITALFPDGFLAGTKATITDAGAILGMKGESVDGWHWDLSTTYGSNSFHTMLRNTNNATQFKLGKLAPTEFYLGTQQFSENTNNINIARDFAKKKGIMQSLNISFGAEFRIENYQIEAGEEASYYDYDTASHRIGGSQVVQGFRPDNAVNKNRYISSIYTEFETELNKKFLIQIAGRYEYYSDFGGNLAGKIAMRYKLSNRFTLRAALSNGFRAPNMQQRYYSLTSQFVSQNYGFVPKVQGVFRNNSQVAQACEIPSLQAEKSINLSGGIAATLSPNISMTIDAYWIQIKGYIALSGTLQRNNIHVLDSILAIYHNDVYSVSFFTNAINTHTRGVDLVLNGNWRLGKSVLQLMLGANFNKTSVFGHFQSTPILSLDSLFFNRQEKARIEQGQPDNKIILTMHYLIKKFAFTLSNIHYGEVAYFNLSHLDEFFSPKTITNVNVDFMLKTWLTLTAGARNIFNVYPDPLQHRENTNSGRLIYGNNVTQFGYNGGYYYMTMSFNF